MANIKNSFDLKIGDTFIFTNDNDLTFTEEITNITKCFVFCGLRKWGFTSIDQVSKKFAKTFHIVRK